MIRERDHSEWIELGFTMWTKPQIIVGADREVRTSVIKTLLFVDSCQLPLPLSPSAPHLDKLTQKPTPPLEPMWSSNHTSPGTPATPIKTRATGFYSLWGPTSHFLPAGPALLSPESPTIWAWQCFHALLVHVWHLLSPSPVCQLGWGLTSLHEGTQPRGSNRGLGVRPEVALVSLASIWEGKLRKKWRRAEIGWNPCRSLLPTAAVLPPALSLSSTHLAQDSERLKDGGCPTEDGVAEVSWVSWASR